MEKPAPNGMSCAEGRQSDRSVPRSGDAAGARAAEVLSQQCPFVALVGEDIAAKNAIIAALLADPQICAICVANPLAAALTLPRIMFQIDGDYAGTSHDDPAGLVQTLVAHGAGEGRFILIVKDAETLDRQVLLSLQDLPETGAPGSLHPRVLFVGLPAFNTLLADDRLTRLRGRLTVVPIDAPNGTPPARSTDYIAPSPANLREAAVPIISPVRGGGATDTGPLRTSSRPWVLGAAIVLAEMFILFTASNDRPLDPANAPTLSQSILRPAPPQPPMPLSDPKLSSSGEIGPAKSPPEVASIAVPDGATGKPLFRVSPRERLLREFDDFLNRAGRDTAKLTGAQRQALFNEFIGWRGEASRTKPAG